MMFGVRPHSSANLSISKVLLLWAALPFFSFLNLNQVHHLWMKLGFETLLECPVTSHPQSLVRDHRSYLPHHWLEQSFSSLL